MLGRAALPVSLGAMPWHALALMRRSPEELLHAIAQGRDRQAFRELFDDWAPRFKGFAMRRGMAMAQADELVQEIMLTIWHKADRYDAGRATASTWLFTIARNRLIDRMRQERRPTMDIDDPALVVAAATQQTEMETDEQRMTVQQALQALPREQAEILERAYFQDESLRSIALDLAIPEGTVKSRVRLAMKRLRELALDWGDR